MVDLYKENGKLNKLHPDYYRTIADMRKIKSGGKYFKDKEAAREAQRKGVESRLRTTRQRQKEERE